MKKLLLLFTLLSTMSFATIRFIGPPVPVVPPPPPPQLVLNCSSPTADYGTVIPAGFLELRLSCTFSAPDINPINGSATFTYITTQNISATDLAMWMGTSNQPFETGTSITITTPDGRQARYSHQYDKHQDIVGSFWRDKQGIYNIPIGSTVVILIVVGLPHGTSDCPGVCAVESMWQFNKGLL